MQDAKSIGKYSWQIAAGNGQRMIEVRTSEVRASEDRTSEPQKSERQRSEYRNQLGTMH